MTLAIVAIPQEISVSSVPLWQFLIRLFGFREGVEQLVPAERLIVRDIAQSRLGRDAPLARDPGQKPLQLADNCVRAKPGAQEAAVKRLDPGGLVQGLGDANLAPQVLAEQFRLVQGFEARANRFLGNLRADPARGEVAPDAHPAVEIVLDPGGDKRAREAGIVEVAVIAEPLQDGLDISLSGLAAKKQGAYLAARTGAAGKCADG